MRKNTNALGLAAFLDASMSFQLFQGTIRTLLKRSQMLQDFLVRRESFSDACKTFHTPPRAPRRCR
eukprot:2473908-Karenia_brevis.AAC.1